LTRWVTLKAGNTGSWVSLTGGYIKGELTINGADGIGTIAATNLGMEVDSVLDTGGAGQVLIRSATDDRGKASIVGRWKAGANGVMFYRYNYFGLKLHSEFDSAATLTAQNGSVVPPRITVFSTTGLELRYGSALYLGGNTTTPLGSLVLQGSNSQAWLDFYGNDPASVVYTGNTDGEEILSPTKLGGVAINSAPPAITANDGYLVKITGSTSSPNVSKSLCTANASHTITINSATTVQ
jgi:hypothetical protein